ncbi:uncharacterized protein LOC123554866 [Mercenaria mercenaria]|uniref:uncharacterized protein LOC123554866 n=1 Tax=Mercenaria mercenaria TaxID=6596 RepID=UPI00234EACF8|nr:uncharacterized protein LOC123554866 [Mercenaria mercenaria]
MDGKTFLRLCFWIILARCCHTLNLTFYCSDVHSYEQHDLYENGIRLDMKTAIVFQTKGMHDAHVLLQKNHSDVVNDIVEIVLGGWSNTRSVMRNQIFGQALSTYYGPVLNNEYQWFWISWDGGCVQVGNGSKIGSNIMMNWCGLNHSVAAMSISYGFGSDGYFKLPKMGCGTPEEIAHGNTSYSGIGEGDMVTYTCNAAYIITSDPATRTCIGDQWSGSPPTCAEIICNPDNSIDVFNLPADYYYLAMQENATGGSDIQCNVADINSNAVTITGCSKDLPILLTFGTYSGIEFYTMHGGKSMVTVTIECSEIPETGNVGAINNTFNANLTDVDKKNIKPTFQVTASLNLTSVIVGNPVAWTISFPMEYILEVTSCVGYPGTDDQSSTSVSLISSGGCSSTSHLITHFSDGLNGTATATLYLFFPSFTHLI